MLPVGRYQRGDLSRVVAMPTVPAMPVVVVAGGGSMSVMSVMGVVV